MLVPRAALLRLLEDAPARPVSLDQRPGRGVCAAARRPIGGPGCSKIRSSGLAAPGPAPTSTVPDRAAPGGSRSGGRAARRPRWDTDAGITARDVAPCAGLASNTPPAPTCSGCCWGRLSPGRPGIAGQLGEETLRQILDRWEDRGLVARDRLLGHLWVAPHVKALRLVGLDVRVWSFVIPQLAHVHAVGVVRLALEPSVPKAAAGCRERELRREAGKSHVPDAAVQLPDAPDLEGAGAGLYGEDVDPLPKRVAVEVELTRKSAARLREAWTRPRHGRWNPDRLLRPARSWPLLTGQLASTSGLAIPSRSTRCPTCPALATCGNPGGAS